MSVRSRLSGPPPSPAWHTLSGDEVLKRRLSSLHGLEPEDAAGRLVEYGPNTIREDAPVRPWGILAEQFNSLLVWLLMAAAIISGILGGWIDAVAILAIVILNAVLGFYLEFGAERAIAALRRMTAAKARVRRGGRVLTTPSSEVVPGDVLVLKAGDLVAADARLLEANDLRCIESALTGESESVLKHTSDLQEAALPPGDRLNMVFLGTAITSGTGQAVVVATGMATEIGHIARLMEASPEDNSTPLKRRLEAFGRTLLWISVGVVALLFAVGLLGGRPWNEIFLVSVSVAVAAVPEGLPAIVTVALALGVQRMAGRHALVRRLPSVETLGCTDVICTDKTGTLTQGEMTVRSCYSLGRRYDFEALGYRPEGKVLVTGRPASDRQLQPLVPLAQIWAGCAQAQLETRDGAWRMVGDPTEGALLAASAKIWPGWNTVDTCYPKLGDIPFSSERKRRSMLRRFAPEHARLLMNGAPEVVLRLSKWILDDSGVRPMSDEDREVLASHQCEMAKSALRVLASAYRDFYGDAGPICPQMEDELVFAGLAGLSDPPRPEAKEAVAACGNAGIRVSMITGDYAHTASAIAKELGIASPSSRLLTGMELDQTSDEELRRLVQETAVYARVTPEHKLRIVRAWKANGAVVAMTGDGVNDAPAVKAADVGIAMGAKGTEVTKLAADIVLADDNFATIVAAVEEGRGIYENIRKTLLYLLSTNVGELALMTGCIAAGVPVPLLPIQLLWINLITDGPPALCLAADPIDPDNMKHPPRPREDRIADRPFLQRMAATGGLVALVALAVFLYGLRTTTLDTARTWAFLTTVFSQLFLAVGARQEHRSVLGPALLQNRSLLLVVVASIVAHVILMTNQSMTVLLKAVPLEMSSVGALLAVSMLPFLAIEIWKATVRFKK